MLLESFQVEDWNFPFGTIRQESQPPMHAHGIAKSESEDNKLEFFFFKKKFLLFSVLAYFVCTTPQPLRLSSVIGVASSDACRVQGRAVKEAQWAAFRTLGNMALQSAWGLHLKRIVTTQFQLILTIRNMDPACQPHYFFRMT